MVRLCLDTSWLYKSRHVTTTPFRFLIHLLLGLESSCSLSFRQTTWRLTPRTWFQIRRYCNSITILVCKTRRHSSTVNFESPHSHYIWVWESGRHKFSGLDPLLTLTSCPQESYVHFLGPRSSNSNHDWSVPCSTWYNKYSNLWCLFKIELNPTHTTKWWSVKRLTREEREKLHDPIHKKIVTTIVLDKFQNK